jgi:hypothetical protein
MVSKSAPSFINFPYTVLRNITAPEDKDNDREVYAGNAPFNSFLDLPNDENIRDCILDVEGKKGTQVHRAIKDTLLNAPQNFSVLNSGIVIVAHRVELDDKNKVLRLENASIINGAQTQGVLKRCASQLSGQPINVKFEIIVTAEKYLIAEISVSRNYQNTVMAISIAGARGHLDDLKRAFEKSIKGKTIRMSETDIGVDIVATEKLLQVITALIPDVLWVKQEDNGVPNKVYTYARKAQCLKEFTNIFQERKNTDNTNQKKFEELYRFYLDVAGDAWELYEKWTAHDGFYGTRIRAIDRGERGEILEVPDGLVFPIFAALSVFMKKTKSGWKLEYPRGFDEKQLIEAAAQAYKEIAKHQPNVMGKSKACYSYVAQIPNMYLNIFKQLSEK